MLITDMASLFGRIRTGARRTGTPLTARRVLMLLFLGSGVRCLFEANQQISGSSGLTLRIVGGVCLAIAAAIVPLRIRVRGPAGHVLVVVLIAVTTVMIGVSPNRGDAILRAFGYPWSALFAAFYMSRPAARSYAVLASMAFALGIAIAGVPEMLSAWVLVTATVVAVTTATSGLVTALRLQSETDPLTGIANRAGFMRLANQALSAAARQREPVAVVVCDIDGLKTVNDLDGHAAGDALLSTVAKAWLPTLRRSDVYARLGGDEFAILLPNTDVDGAEQAMVRLRLATSVAFSAGTAVGAPDEALDDVLARADAAMYANKVVRRAQHSVPTQRRPRQFPAGAKAAPRH
jgi:diguanylate cyclase (GGDEF)-like protein